MDLNSDKTTTPSGSQHDLANNSDKPQSGFADGGGGFDNQGANLNDSHTTTSVESVSSDEPGHNSTMPAIEMKVTAREKDVVLELDAGIKEVDVAFGADDGGTGDGRENWGGKVDFLLSVIGFAVDLANVWRFPYLVYRNGGGAFLIPYVIFLIFGGLPMLYMELAMGQYFRQGAISVWDICPLFQGLGWAVVLIAWYVAFYYNVIIAWSLYYLISSFTSSLPWKDCQNEWNTPVCYDGSFNESWVSVDDKAFLVNSTTGSSPAQEFYERNVLEMHLSEGLHDLVGLKWQLVLCLMAVMVVVYFSLWKGVKSSGKVVWVTATLPYIVLTILLIHGCTLPGSLKGIEYYLRPDFSRLLAAQVWIDAAIQIFYSIGAGFGVHLAYASYNKFHNNIYRDVLFTSAVNCVTSFFAGFVVFAVLGYMSMRTGKDIQDVATEGPGLVFVVYPEAIATMQGSTFWSIIFYLMLITLGLDSSFGGLEAVISGITDKFPRQFRHRRELLTLLVVLSVFLFALFNVTYGGIYMFVLQERFAAGASLLFVVMLEAIGISWLYGIDNFKDNIREMLGFAPGIWWRLCWKIFAPLFLVFIFVVSLALSEPLTYGDYLYPPWGQALGWLLALSSMIVVPAFAVYNVATFEGDSWKMKLAFLITPIKDHDDVRKGKIVRFERKHWLSI
ncbi:sodium-dependent noradrenaline transporter-like [Asterias amurensis]|uniref:sodium-dependent noradrenaline transporter-like n=1 Tax=Asterias amurensis TaxID=7602 RepID=UPI003AB55AC3